MEASMARGSATAGLGLEPPLKRGKIEAANVIVQFQSDTGETVGAFGTESHEFTTLGFLVAGGCAQHSNST